MPPMVQAKLLGVLDVKDIAVEPPLQMLLEIELVTTGIGFTVTVIVYGLPIQVPPVDVGVTTYSTVPNNELLGLLSN